MRRGSKPMYIFYNRLKKEMFIPRMGEGSVILRGRLRSYHCCSYQLDRKDVFLHNSNSLGSTRTRNHFCVKTWNQQVTERNYQNTTWLVTNVLKIDKGNSTSSKFAWIFQWCWHYSSLRSRDMFILNKKWHTLTSVPWRLQYLPRPFSKSSNGDTRGSVSFIPSPVSTVLIGIMWFQHNVSRWPSRATWDLNVVECLLCSDSSSVQKLFNGLSYNLVTS